jgi:predicted Zn finger-like uncharacterized protein
MVRPRGGVVFRIDQGRLLIYRLVKKMKITCQACDSKYQISDEKTRGRTLKVKCKNCASIILVDGTHLVDEPAKSPSTEEDVFWTVNLSETDQPTLNVSQMIEMYQQGTMTDQTYIWREGMDDWLMVAEVPEVAEALREALGAHDGVDDRNNSVPAPYEQSPSEQPNEQPAENPYQAQAGGYEQPPAQIQTPMVPPDVGSDLGDDDPTTMAPIPADLLSRERGFSAGVVPAAGSPAVAASAQAITPQVPETSGNDLFGGFGEANPAPAARRANRAGSTAGADLFGAASAVPQSVSSHPPPPASHKHIGERNENSVLFSLSSFTSQSKEESGGSSGGSLLDDAIPAGGDEASGIIDMRILAKSAGMKKTEEQQETKKEQKVDKLMNLGGTPLFDAAPIAPAAPVASAGHQSIAAPAETKSNTMVLVVAMVILLGAVAFAAFYFVK